MAEDLQSRRTVIAGVGAGGLAMVLAACGGEGGSTSAAPQAQESSAAPSASASASASGPTGSGGGALATAADVPVGGGTIFKEQKVVVTQPAAGQFKCFSAICTHKGCPVTSVGSGTIDCACHGSKFSIEDGSVKGGPATTPLAEVPIKVDGDSIALA
ncbi:Rieske (2Fe-2S) protein [Nonomuraea sp. NPDC059194]|uniref:Rieske (2Fe-2S) protein n=1 Tax=Nonomuraea sp. NPDC059194 TaxID=3346764 RepID=UPI0036CB5EAA